MGSNTYDWNSIGLRTSAEHNEPGPELWACLRPNNETNVQDRYVM